MSHFNELDLADNFPVYLPRELLLLMPRAPVNSEHLRPVVLQHASERQRVGFGAYLADLARHRNVEMRVQRRYWSINNQCRNATNR